LVGTGEEMLQSQILPTRLSLPFIAISGGCVGCLNLNDPGNGGLGNVFNEINELYTDIFPVSAEKVTSVLRGPEKVLKHSFL